MKYILAIVALFAPAALMAQASTPAAKPSASKVTLSSETFVAKAVTNAKGVKENKLFPADRVLPGDPLVFQLSYQNVGTAAASRFVIDNPVPAGVFYSGAREAWATVSIDGGKNFAALSALKIKKADGTLRGAIPQDVTQIRWTFAQPIAVGAKGSVMFYAVVK